jgi:protein SCO1/2
MFLKAYAIKKWVDDKMEPSYGRQKKFTMARKSYLAVKMGKPSELYDMVHTENFVLVDAKESSRFYDGTKRGYQLITDI